MDKNLYEILELEKDASLEDIRKSFRSKARILHPDMPTGNLKAFQELSEAYYVLSDPDLRNQYDTTGEFSKDSYESLKTDFLGVLATTFQVVIDEAGDQIYRVDIINVMKQHIAQIRNSQKASLGNKQNKIRHLEKVKRMIKRHGEGENLFTKILDANIDNLKEQIRGTERAVKIGDMCLEELKHYKTEVELARSIFPDYATTFTINSTF